VLHIEHQPRHLVVAVVGVSVVITLEACLRRQHLSAQAVDTPRRPARVADRHGRQCRPLERPRDGLAQDLGPQGLGAPLVQQHIAVVEQARDAEARGLSAHAGFKRDARAAERAVGDGDRLVAESAVDDLVPVQDAHGVGARYPLVLDAQDPIGIGQAGACGLHEARLIDGACAVARRATGLDGRDTHQRAAQVEAVERSCRRTQWCAHRGDACSPRRRSVSIASSHGDDPKFRS
jgi:hypothetical protein